MAANSKIEWTDHTFNPWEGCEKISPACKHCYAADRDERWHAGKHWGLDAPRLMHTDAYWRQPLKWNRDAIAAGERRRVFCASLADVFEDRADLLAPRARLFTLIKATPGLDWLLLTKRPENIDRLWRAAHIDAFNGADSLGIPSLPNVWLGCTAEDQRYADERIPHLLACKPLASKLFVSYEPALGPIDFRLPKRLLVTMTYVHPDYAAATGLKVGDTVEHRTGIDWIIAGGESGSKARPMREEWIRSVRDQCIDAGVAFFYKQKLDGRTTKVSLPLLDGVQHAAVPT